MFQHQALSNQWTMDGSHCQWLAKHCRACPCQRKNDKGASLCASVSLAQASQDVTQNKNTKSCHTLTLAPLLALFSFHLHPPPRAFPLCKQLANCVAFVVTIARSTHLSSKVITTSDKLLRCVCLQIDLQFQLHHIHCDDCTLDLFVSKGHCKLLRCVLFAWPLIPTALHFS